MVCYYLSVTHKTQIGGIWNSRGLKISLKSNKWGSEKIGWVVNFSNHQELWMGFTSLFNCTQMKNIIPHLT